MSPKNPGKAVKSIRAKIAFPASIAVTTAAVCVSVCDDVPAARKSEQIQGNVKMNYPAASNGVSTGIFLSPQGAGNSPLVRLRRIKS